MKLQQMFLFSTLFVIGGLALHGKEEEVSIQEASDYFYAVQHLDTAFEALKKVTLRGNEKVLDIGCGQGKITANLAGRVPYGEVVGLDMSRGKLAYAEKTYTPFYPNLSFVKGDIFEYLSPFEFDLVFSSSSFHWVQDHLPLLVQIQSLLKPQGNLLLTIPSSPSHEIKAIFKDMTIQKPWQAYLEEFSHPRRKYNPEEYALLMKQAGYQKIEVARVPITYVFDTKQEFANWFASYSLMIYEIPEEKRRLFLTQLVDRYLKTFPMDKMGRVVFTQDELIVKGQRKG